MSSGRSTADMAALRVRYEAPSLVEETVGQSPLAQFDEWFAEAEAAGVPEPNAISLATCGADGPAVRAVLAKSVTSDGVRFFTNLRSDKARQLEHDPRIAATFIWIPQHRQILFRGRAEPLPRAEVAEYFAQRPRDAQIGAWASPQSREIESRAWLRDRVDEVTERFADETVPIPVPDHWGGYLIRAASVEFWQGQPSRLHDRLRFVAGGPDRFPLLDDASGWRIRRLAP